MAKNRVDSAHVKTAIAESAAKGIQPPKNLKLRPEDEPFWRDIINARFEWTDVDLYHAYNLAQTLADIPKLRKLVDEEGYTVMGSAGGVVVNPTVKVLDMMIKSSMSLATKIQVHTSATIGEIEDNRKKNAAKNKAVQALKGQAEDDDDLIARPVH